MAPGPEPRSDSPSLEEPPPPTLTLLLTPSARLLHVLWLLPRQTPIPGLPRLPMLLRLSRPLVLLPRPLLRIWLL